MFLLDGLHEDVKRALPISQASSPSDQEKESDLPEPPGLPFGSSVRGRSYLKPLVLRR